MTVRTVPLQTSFGDTMQRLGVDARTVSLLERSYAGVIDFRRDLRQGDTVSVVLAPPAAGVNADPAKGDPLTVALPGDGTGLHGDERKRFAAQARRLSALL